MAKSTQPSHIIICDASAFRALRCERRRYQGLGWTPLSSREIHLAVSCSSANANCIDYDLWNNWASGVQARSCICWLAVQPRGDTPNPYIHTLSQSRYPQDLFAALLRGLRFFRQQ